MKRTIVAGIITIVVVALAGFGTWYLTNFPATDSGAREPVVIGVPPNEQSTLILIAEDQGFFAGNGLNATIRIYDTALNAVAGMEKGEADVAESAEFPVVRESFKKANISIIAGIDRFGSVFLAGRKDRGIENVSDLKGKRIGYAKGTLTEFYLGRFLDLHGISLQEVTLVNMQFTQSAEALANGSVHAFQVQNKDIPAIEERLEGGLVIWPSQSGQSGYEVISGRNDWIASHPETINRLLKSLAQAEKFVIDHPAEEMAIVQKRLNYTDAYMATVPPQHRYALTLDQSMVLAMEDEGRWMINNNLTTERTIPDYRDYINTKGLKEVKPDSVNIIE